MWRSSSLPYAGTTPCVSGGRRVLAIEAAQLFIEWRILFLERARPLEEHLGGDGEELAEFSRSVVVQDTWFLCLDFGAETLLALLQHPAPQPGIRYTRPPFSLCTTRGYERTQAEGVGRWNETLLGRGWNEIVLVRQLVRELVQDNVMAIVRVCRLGNHSLPGKNDHSLARLPQRRERSLRHRAGEPLPRVANPAWDERARVNENLAQTGERLAGECQGEQARL